MSYVEGQVVNGHVLQGGAWVQLPPQAAPPPPPGPQYAQPTVPQARGPLAGVNEAEVYRKGANFRATQNLVKIGGIWLKPSSDKAGIWNFIVETEIRHSVGGRPTSVRKDHVGPLSLPHTTGEMVAWVTTSEHKSFPGNVKGFCLAMLGGDESPEGIENFAYTLADPATQPGTGKILYVDAVMVLTKEGKDFTAVNWMPASSAPAGFGVLYPAAHAALPPPPPGPFVPPPPPGTGVTYGVPPMPPFRPQG